MRLSVKSLISYLLLPILLVVSSLTANAASGKGVLIITSYNPDTQSMTSTLSSFVDEYEKHGGNSDAIVVESLNCLAYSEAKTWKERMGAILSKHRGDATPGIVVVLGQEAWSAFLSQDNPEFRKLPVLCGMVSRNTILTPPDSVSLDTWMPVSMDVMKDFPDFNIVGGYVYQYRLFENIALAKKLFPFMRELVFLSDNSFGGVSMQAMVKSEMKKYPEYSFSFLDGRVESLVEVSHRISNLSPHCVLLCGTWRVGPSDDFVLKSTTYVLRDANPVLPAFSVSSIGLGHWALGGYIPDYHNLGEGLARQSLEYLQSGGKAAIGLRLVGNKYVFDSQRIDMLEVDESLLPEGTEIINRTPTLWDEYENEIIAVGLVILCLLGSLVVSAIYIRRIRKYRNMLEEQSRELAKAKDAAEQASAMKTNFIQNINHEIRTPLNAIVGFAQVFANANTCPMKKYASIIERNSNDLLKLIGDVVELSNLDAGDFKDTPQPVVMSELCRVALRQVESKINDDVEFVLIPPVDDRPRLMYRHMVELVVVNLLHNAFKFTISGTVTLHCDVLPGEKKMRVSVTDTGYGIPADKHEVIFERFTKLDEFKQGGGLGLAICRAVAKRIDATVTIDPDYTTGSKFIFIFPLLD